MASVSIELLRGGNTNPDALTIAAAAPTTANAIQVRIDEAAGFTTLEVKDALDAFFRYWSKGRI